MNPKDQLDNNELEQNQELPGKELPDIKEREIVGNLGELEKKVDINIIKNTEKIEEKVNTIEQTREEEEKIKKEIIKNKTNKNNDYTPGFSNRETDTLERANEGRKKSLQKVKDYIQQYPGWLKGFVKSIDKLSQ